MKLLVAIDGSPPSRHAIEAAARLARLGVDVEALLVNVREGAAYYGELPPFDHTSIEASLRERQNALLEAALAQARQAGLKRVGSVAVEGMPAAAIVRLAGEHAVDGIVMGTRGMNALGGLLLGSVAQRVVHLATVPVTLCR